MALLVLECLQSCGLFFTRELGSHESHFQTLQSMVPNSHVCPTQWVRWKALLPNRYMASPRMSPSSTLGRLFLGNMLRRVVSLVAIGDPCDNNNVMEACITYISSPPAPFSISLCPSIIIHTMLFFMNAPTFMRFLLHKSMYFAPTHPHYYRPC